MKRGMAHLAPVLAPAVNGAGNRYRCASDLPCPAPQRPTPTSCSLATQVDFTIPAPPLFPLPPSQRQRRVHARCRRQRGRPLLRLRSSSSHKHSRSPLSSSPPPTLCPHDQLSNNVVFTRDAGGNQPPVYLRPCSSSQHTVTVLSSRSSFPFLAPRPKPTIRAGQHQRHVHA